MNKMIRTETDNASTSLMFSQPMRLFVCCRGEAARPWAGGFTWSPDMLGPSASAYGDLMPETGDVLVAAMMENQAVVLEDTTLH